MSARLLKLTQARDLPPPGTAVVEVMACDLRHDDGRRVVRRFCGERILQELLNRRARFVSLTLGDGGCVVVPYTETDFAEIGAYLIELAPFAPGPIVFCSFGVAPQLRERMLAGAERRDLELAEPAGRA